MIHTGKNYCCSADGVLLYAKKGIFYESFLSTVTSKKHAERI